MCGGCRLPRRENCFIIIHFLGFLKLEKKMFACLEDSEGRQNAFLTTFSLGCHTIGSYTFSSNELMIAPGSRRTKHLGRGEDNGYCPIPDTLLYDWSKFIGDVRKLIQVISVSCISLNVKTVAFESFLFTCLRTALPVHSQLNELFSWKMAALFCWLD